MRGLLNPVKTSVQYAHSQKPFKRLKDVIDAAHVKGQEHRGTKRTQSPNPGAITRNPDRIPIRSRSPSRSRPLQPARTVQAVTLRDPSHDARTDNLGTSESDAMLADARLTHTSLEYGTVPPTVSSIPIQATYSRTVPHPAQTGLPSHARPPRRAQPGWTERVRETPDLESDICFKCFGIGHRRPQCPVEHPDARNPPALTKFMQFILQNWQRVPEAEQQRMLSMGVTPFKIPGVFTDAPTSPRRRYRSPPPPAAVQAVHGPDGASAEVPHNADPLQTIDVGAIAQRPYGLPPARTYSDYVADPVCPLSAHNYKLDMAIGASPTRYRKVLSVLDTGAGPNVIRADAVPDGLVDSIDTSKNVVNLSSASRDPLDVLGILYLHVKIAGYSCKQPFVVVRELSSDALLGTTFIDEHVEVIWVRRALCILRDQTLVPIQKRASPTTVRDRDEPRELREKPKPAPQVRVRRAVQIPARSEGFVEVTVDCSGRLLLEPDDRSYGNKLVSMAPGVADVQARQPLLVKIANFSNTPAVLRRLQLIGTATVAPDTIFSVNLDEGTVTPDATPLPSAHRSRGARALRRHSVAVQSTVPDPVPGSPVATVSPMATVSPPVDATSTEGRANAPPHRVVPSRILERIPPPPEPPDASSTPKIPQFSLDDVDLSHLDQAQQVSVRKMLAPFSSMWDGSLGRVNVAVHRIETPKDARPFRSQPYRAGPKMRELEEQEIKRQLDLGVIRPSQSEWASPVLLVPKPDGSKRFCVDYRRLNLVTTKDSYPLPRMDECMDSLGEAVYFTLVDANCGYWQIEVHKDDRAKTAFVCHQGAFEYVRMPFGLCNAPPTFQRTMDILLAGYRWKTCLVYLDDVIIFSKTFDDHVQDVRNVLNCLKAAGFSLKLSKCSFFKDEVDYLGHVVKPGKLAVAQKTTEAVKNFKPLETVTHVKSFLGLCNVYRRFVPNFARVAAPLNKLTRKGVSPKLPPLTEEQLQSIQKLKDALISAPILALPRPGLPYSMDTDACDYQVGVVLLQLYPDGTRHPIGYWSRSLNDAERNYSTTEKECLAVVWGCQILRPYLEGETFGVYTDHQALKWLLGATDVSGRLARWRLRLSEFDFSVEYKTGKKNTLADALSRLPTAGETNVAPDLDVPVCTLCVNHCTHEPGDGDDLLDDEHDLDHYAASHVSTVEPAALSAITHDELVAEQATDAYCRFLRRKIHNGVKIPFEIGDNCLLVRISHRDHARQTVIPIPLRERILHIHHYSKPGAHAGGIRMYNTLRQYAYWPSMAVDVYNVVRNCVQCAQQRIKLRKHSGFMKLFPAKRPGEHVAIDILGPLPKTGSGFQYILVITDRFSKMTKVFPLRGISAYQVAKAFCSEWVYHYGQPAYLLSDRGTQFTSQFFKNVCKILGVKQAFTSAYHPQTNGQTERFNRTLLASLRCFCTEHGRDWDAFLQAVAYGYNCTVHTATKCTPFELMLTQPPPPLALARAEAVDHSDLTVQNVKERLLARLSSLLNTAADAMSAAQARYKKDFDARVRPSPHTYSVGDLVLVRREAVRLGESYHKLLPPSTGPHEIIRVHHASRCAIVRLEHVDSTVSFDRLTPVPRQRVAGQPAATPPNAPVAPAFPPRGSAPPLPADPVPVPPADPVSAGPATGTRSRNRVRFALPPSPDGEAPRLTTHNAPSRRSALRQLQAPAQLPALQPPEPVAHRTRARRRTSVASVTPSADPRAAARAADSSRTHRRLEVVDFLPPTNRYRVRWSGLPPSGDTFEPAAHIPLHLVQKFRRERLLPALPSEVWK